jgi:hypothetical protein
MTPKEISSEERAREILGSPISTSVKRLLLGHP